MRTEEEVSRVAKDPVCGMDVDEKKAAATSVYKGETYYFCAEVCKKKFDHDPGKYVKKGKD
jgi:YHS domain-containing protein